MSTQLDMGTIIEKTEELCRSILHQPAFKELKDLVEAFVTNEEAIAQYNRFTNKQRTIQQKQHNGVPISQEEIKDFENEEDSFFTNRVIMQFIQAQREFEKVHDLVSKYIIKTVELDRLPTEEDLAEGSCGCGGGGCGCGGH